MICNKCGNEMPDGVKFCPRCGAAMEQPQTPPPAAEEPVNAGGYQGMPTPPPNMGGQNPFGNFQNTFSGKTNTMMSGKGNIWLAIIAALTMLSALSIICSGVAYPGVEIPFMLNVGSNFSPTPMSVVGYIFYLIFAVINMLLLLSAFIFVLKKQSLGVILGIAANMMLLIMSIVMIIIAFCAFYRMGSASLWNWLALPVSLMNVAAYVIKGKAMISK